MARRRNYPEIFNNILKELSPGEKIDSSVVLEDSRLPGNVSLKTKKNHFRRFLEENPAWLKSITGIVPKPETIVSLVESEIGPVVESNLVRANVACRSIVNSITRPMVGRFIREELGTYYESSGVSLNIPEEQLLEFLLEGFSTYLRAAGNGLVSVAGALNEKLLHRALINGGMRLNEDFGITGTDSEADIQVFTHVGTRESLGVEVKSYAARERLLRGLRDVKEPKVGVGYFNNPQEFGLGRTITYLQARPAAIYIPGSTLEEISRDAKRQVVNERVAFGSALYRPLERFVSDMKAYTATGLLPKYLPPQKGS